jgi:hypothetical protein
MRVRRHRPEVRSIAQSATVLDFGAIPARVTFVLTRIPNSGSGADALPDPGRMHAVGQILTKSVNKPLPRGNRPDLLDAKSCHPLADP